MQPPMVTMMPANCASTTICLTMAALCDHAAELLSEGFSLYNHAKYMDRNHAMVDRSSSIMATRVYSGGELEQWR